MSILVLTKNESRNIDDCLKSVAFSDDIVVLDSCSTDDTVERARRYEHVRTYSRTFDDWATHGNWALQHLHFKHPWVYYIDADERIPAPLRDEIAEVIASDSFAAAYRVSYVTYLRGRPIRHGGVFPVWVLRLMRPTEVRYERRLVNAHPVVSGAIGTLNQPYDHYTFSHGLQSWLRKHNSYSTMEASEARRLRTKEGPSSALWMTIKSRGDRRALKELSFYVPMRGLARFLYAYVLKRGFLDGRPGFEWAFMISVYESWIGAKMRMTELEAQALHQEIDRRIRSLDGSASDARNDSVPSLLRMQFTILKRLAPLY